MRVLIPFLLTLTNGCDTHVPRTPVTANPLDPDALDEMSRAAKASVPIVGGTMITGAASGQFIAADPDNDTMLFWRKGYDTASVTQLEQGDMPTRLVMDDEGKVHVILRGTGELVTLDSQTQQVTNRARVCNLPRGIDFGADGTLSVACAEGKLIRVDPYTLQSLDLTTLPDDLRDVVVEGPVRYV